MQIESAKIDKNHKKPGSLVFDIQGSELPTENFRLQIERSSYNDSYLSEEGWKVAKGLRGHFCGLKTDTLIRGSIVVVDAKMSRN